MGKVDWRQKQEGIETEMKGGRETEGAARHRRRACWN